MFEFGSGTVWITPVAGNQPVNPTPIEIGTLQDCSLDISFDLKMLYGQNQFPESIARGKGKISGKAKFGRFNSDLLNQMMFAQTRTTGSKGAQKDESHTLTGTVVGAITAAVINAAGTGFAVGDLLSVGGAGTGGVLKVATITGSAIATFTIITAGVGNTTATGVALTVLTGGGSGSPTADITGSAGVAPGAVTVTNSATWLLDLGVRYGATGIPLLKIASGTPAVGQYRVNSGVYAFATADSGLAMLVSYLDSVTAGVTQAISNQLMGFQPIVTVTFRQLFNGQEAIIFLYSVVIGKMMLASKLDDYTIPEIDFEAFADGSGKVLDFYAAE